MALTANSAHPKLNKMNARLAAYAKRRAEELNPLINEAIDKGSADVTRLLDDKRCFLAAAAMFRQRIVPEDFAIGDVPED